MNLKKIWVSGFEGSFSISMRQLPGSERWMRFSESELPPIEPIKGKQLNIDQAKMAGLVEWHYILHSFTEAELLELRSAIDDALAGSPRRGA